MSSEAHGNDPDESLVPPAATRWSDGDAGSGELEEVLSPPFVPGRQRTERASAPQADAPSADEPLLEEPIVEEPAVQKQEPASESEEPFPFEAAVDEPVLAEPAVEEPAIEEPSMEEPVIEDDFPFDQFDIEGEAGQAEESAQAEKSQEWTQVDEPVATGSAAMGWTPAELDVDDAAGAEGPEFPEIEEPEFPKIEEPGFPEAEEALEPELTRPEAATEVARDMSDMSDPAQEAAAVLDRLAERLRAEGEQGMRDEMDSPDRITALIAGLLAGYVSGRS